MVSLEESSLVVFCYIITSEIWPDKSGGLSVGDNKRGGLSCRDNKGGGLSCRGQ